MFFKFLLCLFLQVQKQNYAENQCMSNFAHCAKIRAARKFSLNKKIRAVREISRIACSSLYGHIRQKRNSQVKKKPFENVFIFIFNLFYLIYFY